jgi:hypothetical protein
MVASVLPIALMMLAQATAAPAANESPRPASAAKSEPRCGVPTDGNTIVVCAEKPDGYRINPDVMAAKKGNRPDPGAPRPNNLTLRPDCHTVGPAPCMYGGVNLLGAALTAVQMAQRLSSGQEIGSMFKTTPSMTEYERYQLAKAQREAQEQAEAAARAKAKAVAAQAAAQAPQPASAK